MMHKSFVLYFLILWGVACGQIPVQTAEQTGESPKTGMPLFFPAGNTLQTRILPAPGFNRVHTPSNSFAQFLRDLPLKPDGAKVELYNGEEKGNQLAHVAVVDLPIGDKNLHQCADAVMRLRAEYLWKQGKFEEIQFHFTNGFLVKYSEWMQGKRIAVQGNKTYWVARKAASNTYHDFWAYLETVFTYAGTLSLAKELQPVGYQDLAIGDVFIQGGSPGHAVLVVDMAENSTTGQKVFLLAQSYMPAQEIHILKNPTSAAGDPWYPVVEGIELNTPEWTFKTLDAKRF